jgi:hypothetical protein
MAPPGESLFSAEFFSNLNGTCPYWHLYGWGIEGHPIGVYEERIIPMLMGLPFFFVWLALRKIFKTFFPRLAAYLGITNKKKQEKFSYQLWLVFYYGSSTIMGFIGYRDEAWFQFPLGNDACTAMFEGYPKPPSKYLDFAYQYQLGFYFAEIVALFQETRRSDFVEYVVHHVITILLVAMSNIDSHMRVGGYIFFIHDIADIWICMAKCFNYLKKEFWSTLCFAVFVILFVVTRLISLPSATYCLMCQTGRIGVSYSISFQFLCIIMCVGLQSLHIFWFGLVIKMLMRLASGGSGDVRSDDDEEEVTDKKEIKENKKKKESSLVEKIENKKKK